MSRQANIDDPEDARRRPDTLIVGRFQGIKNTVNPERLQSNELEAAVNIDIDDALQARRRRGYARVATGDFHSLHTAESGVTFAVRDNQIVHIAADLTITPIGDGGADPVAWLDFAGTTYFASRAASGKILPDLTIEPWGQAGGAGEWLSPVVNPTATLGEVAGRLLGRPPMAEFLTELNGRIWLAEGRTIWVTELYAPDLVDRTRNFMQFEAPITGMLRCTSGVYVGTETAVYFLSGALGEMRRQLVAETGCIRGSMIRTRGDLAMVAGEPAAQHRDAIMFMIDQGLIVGFDNGFCRNITWNETLFPTASRVAPMMRRQDGMHQYVAALDSGGAPSSDVNIGAYVHAEIRRANRPS